ncbi:Calcineurin-like phosphoesterase [Posidoniimonas corsicana]|uniref:Calcineurin-like phosphoesterase n=1 Tax=Posidoniimonas corsicana TaxID=1938618 RepID=A0A5C5V2S5_9BACT|nr:DNRLRE domain-containing protein [Posidoniimonas corsicana]TWT32290.1 Calcineurin-like phosphoesterase [Posidoniimonas corsicana]
MPPCSARAFHRKWILAALLLGIAARWCEAVESFTVVALPDTQNYVNSSSNAPLFTQQTEWIADQVQSAGNPRNIQFVTHLGDVVSSGDDLTQLARADHSLDVLDGVLPYSVLPGNHDYADTSDKASGFDDYLDYFGPQRFAGRSWFGGADTSGANSYQHFSAGGHEFLHLALEWRPTINLPGRAVSPLAWAQSVLNAHPDTPVILSTHEHIDDSPAGRSPSGQDLWDELIRFNDQVFMVLGGHYHSVGGQDDGEYHQVSLNDAGRPVIEVLQDYQDYPNGGDGWLRLINFDLPNNAIEFETYSPTLDQFQTETVEQVGQHASRFTLPIDFADRLSPVSIERPAPPRPADLVLQNGLNGYLGAHDKELRSSGGDSLNGGDHAISVDGDDGPGTAPNQALIRFDDLAQHLPADLRVDRAELVLQVFNEGSGFTVHQLLTPWTERSTWADLGDGVQPDGVEAAAEPLAAFGADNDGANVGAGPLTIDVTQSVRAVQDGSLDNLGWALLPLANGTNGVDFYSSEFSEPTFRPMLQLYLSLPGDFNADGVVDAADFTVWRDNLQQVGESMPADADGDGAVGHSDYLIWRANFGRSLTGVSLAAQSLPAQPTPAPTPAAAVLMAAAALGVLTRRRRSPTFVH